MSEPKNGLQIVAAPAGGWCEPDTGVCHIDTTDDTPVAEAADEPAEVDTPAGSGSTERRRPPRR
jgi:hypothetical protein